MDTGSFHLGLCDEVNIVKSDLKNGYVKGIQ